MALRIAPRWLLASLLGLCLAAPARADDGAEALFERGLALMRERNFVDACPLLEQSLALEPDMTTEFRLAECVEQTGKLASALRHYEAVAAAAAGDPERERYARQQIERVRPRVPELTLVVDPAATVVLDGETVADARRPILVDAGEHHIVATAPGKQRWANRVHIAETQQMTVRIALEPLPAVPPEAPAPEQPEAPSPWLSPLAIAAYAVGGAGLIGMGAGVALGVAAKSRYDDSLAECEDERYCSPRGLDMQDTALSEATAGTVVFIVGAAALVGGGVLMYFALSDDGAVEAAVGPGSFDVRLRF